MYTTDHLIQDCVGQFIECQPYSINRSSLLNDRQYCEIWTCLLQWTEKQIKRKSSFIIPHLGLIKYNNNTSDCHQTQFSVLDNHENKKWKFYIESRYITEQNTKLGQKTNIDTITEKDLYNSAAIKCHISSLSKYSSSLSESQLLVGLQHIFRKLFQQIGRSTVSTKNYNDIDSHFEPHLKILINFGWGYLFCCDGIIDFIFTLNESLIINPNIPKGLKHIPKKYLQSTSSLLSYSSIPSNIKIAKCAQKNHEITQYAVATKQIQEYKQHYTLPVDNDYENPLVHLSSRHTIPASLDKSEFPPVLSQFSRILGSTYADHTNYEAPSTKIGLFYTPTSSLYRINTTSKQIEYTDYLPFFQCNPEKYYAGNAKKLLEYQLKYNFAENKENRSDVSCLEIDIATSYKRYYEYIYNHMDDCDAFIPSLRDELIANILNKLEPDLAVISQQKVEEILKNDLNAIQCDNVTAIKQSILDYVLKNKSERIRLNIQIPPHHIHEWGYSPLPFSAPLAWNNQLQNAWNSINSSAYFVNISIIEMLALWQNYKHYRLFCTPSKLQQDENDKRMAHKYIQPMSLQEFSEEQEQHLEFVRNVFVNNWYNDCVNIMKKYVEENGLDSSEESTLKLFSGVAAFMSCKLCEIVYESLNDVILFFEEYKTAQIAVYDENVLNIANPQYKYQCLWKIGLEFMGRDGIEYEMPLEEIEVTINEMIENIVTCFDGINCVEGKIFGLLENVTNLSVFVDAEIQQKTRNNILNVTNVFIKELICLKDLYSNQFASLFANNELTTQLMQIEHNQDITDNLSEFRKEIQKYEEIRQNVINNGKLTVKIGLFSVECQTINSLIVNHAQDLKNGITNYVAKKLINKSQHLVINYEEKSKKLLNKPQNATELIDLIKEIVVFNKSELSEWENISNEIGNELSFLFETDHGLTHDLLRNVGRVSDWNKKIIQHKRIGDKNVMTQTECIKTMVNEKAKQFEIKMKKLYQEVEGLQLLSEIRDDAKIENVKANMKLVAGEKEYIENEQRLLEIDQSQFKMYKLLQDAVGKL